MTVIFNSPAQRFRGFIERNKAKADGRIKAHGFRHKKKVRSPEAYAAAVAKNEELLGNPFVKEHRVRRYALKSRSKKTVTLPKLKFLEKEGWDR